MNYVDLASTAAKLQPFIELLTRAQSVLSGAAVAEQTVAELNAKTSEARLAAEEAIARKEAAIISLDSAVAAKEAANIEAAAIVTNAKTQADTLVVEAKTVAAQLAKDASAQVSVVATEKKQLDNDMLTLLMDINRAKTEYEAIVKRIADAKAAALAALS